jgi:hypothetical protein
MPVVARRMVTVPGAVQTTEARRNGHPATIDWRFMTKDARLKLKSLYPKYLL